MDCNSNKKIIIQHWSPNERRHETKKKNKKIEEYQRARLREANRIFGAEIDQTDNGEAPATENRGNGDLGGGLDGGDLGGRGLGEIWAVVI